MKKSRKSIRVKSASAPDLLAEFLRVFGVNFEGKFHTSDFSMRVSIFPSAFYIKISLSLKSLKNDATAQAHSVIGLQVTYLQSDSHNHSAPGFPHHQPFSRQSAAVAESSLVPAESVRLNKMTFIFNTLPGLSVRNQLFSGIRTNAAKSKRRGHFWKWRTPAISNSINRLHCHSLPRRLKIPA